MARQPYKQRELAPDLIRVIACFMVICVHFYGSSIYSLGETTLRVAFGDGVALFFILSGFFLFRKSFTHTLKRTVLHVLIPGLIVMLLIMFFSAFLTGTASLSDVFLHSSFRFRDYFYNILHVGSDSTSTGHLWYIFNYFFLVLAIPCLKPLCSENKYSSYRIIIISVACVLTLYEDFRWYHPELPQAIIYSAFPAWIIYPIAGFEIHSREGQLKKSKPASILSGLAFFFFFLLRILLQYHQYQIDPSQNRFVFWNCGLGMVCSILFTVFVISLPLPETKPLRLIAIPGLSHL